MEYDHYNRHVPAGYQGSYPLHHGQQEQRGGLTGARIIPGQYYSSPHDNRRLNPYRDDHGFLQPAAAVGHYVSPAEMYNAAAVQPLTSSPGAGVTAKQNRMVVVPVIPAGATVSPLTKHARSPVVTTTAAMYPPPALVANQKYVSPKKPIKLNKVTVSPTKSADVKKQKRNKVSKEDLKRAMNLPINADDAKRKGDKLKGESTDRRRDNTRNGLDSRPKRNEKDRRYREGSKRSKRKRNSEKIYDSDESNNDQREEYSDEYESESEEEIERRHDSRSRKIRDDSPDDSYIDRRDRYARKNYRDGPSRSRSRRKHRNYDHYEYDAVEVGINDEPWYFQASDMIQDSCPALNCDGYAEPMDDYSGNIDRRQGRQRDRKSVV